MVFGDKRRPRICVAISVQKNVRRNGTCRGPGRRSPLNENRIFRGARPIADPSGRASFLQWPFTQQIIGPDRPYEGLGLRFCDS